MDFDLSDRQRHWLDRVKNFMQQHVEPAVPTYRAQMNDTSGTLLFTSTLSPAAYTTGLTLDHTQSYLLA